MDWIWIAIAAISGAIFGHITEAHHPAHYGRHKLGEEMPKKYDYDLVPLGDAIAGEVFTVQVEPVPEKELWVHFAFYGENGGAAINWVKVDENGQASQQILSPTYDSGPGTAYVYAGDGFSARASAVEIFPIAG